MTRILLADDSPHAQRMGERILREEGFEVVTVTDGDTALIRLPDVNPDIVLADAFLPNRNGYEICRFIKNHPKHRRARVVLTAGLLEPLDEQEAKNSGADAILKKPFEASVVVSTLKPLIEAARAERGPVTDTAAPAVPGPGPATPVAAVPQPRPAVPSPVAAVPQPRPAAPSPVAAVPQPKPVAPPRATGVPLPPTVVPAAPPPQPASPAPAAAQPRPAPAPPAPEIDIESVRAAVTLALEAALPTMIDEITVRVLVALGH